MTLLRRRRQLGVVMHDGDRWYAVVYRHRRGRWHAVESAWFEHPNPKHLPGDVLGWVAERGAGRLRVIVHGEVYSLRMSLPERAHPEEIHTGIAYEAASEMGVDAQFLRVSAVRGDSYRLGGSADQVLVVGHEQPVLERYHRDCREHGLRCEGVGCLALVALARHPR